MNNDLYFTVRQKFSNMLVSNNSTTQELPDWQIISRLRQRLWNIFLRAMLKISALSMSMETRRCITLRVTDVWTLTWLSGYVVSLGLKTLGRISEYLRAHSWSVCWCCGVVAQRIRIRNESSAGHTNLLQKGGLCFGMCLQKVGVVGSSAFPWTKDWWKRSV